MSCLLGCPRIYSNPRRQDKKALKKKPKKADQEIYRSQRRQAKKLTEDREGTQEG